MEVVYCCRKCRKPLFRETNLVDESQHDKVKHSFSSGKTSACTSFFLIEPEGWMNLDEAEGKLLCPKCETRFGTYVWAGSQCSCGHWVVPALQVPKSKVDPRKMTLEAAQLGRPSS